MDTVLTSNNISDVLDCCIQAQCHWRNLGTDLKLDRKTMEEIEKRQGSDQDKLFAVLRKWMEKGRATLAELSRACPGLDISAIGGLSSLTPSAAEKKGEQIHKALLISKKLNQPRGIAVTTKKELVVTETGTDPQRVVIFKEDGKEVRSFPLFQEIPHGVAIDGQGFIYVSDRSSKNRLHKFTPKLIEMSTINCPLKGSEHFDHPHGLTVVNDSLVVCDNSSCRVQILNLDLEYQDTFGDGKNTEQQHLYGPIDIASDSKDFIYVTDDRIKSVVKFHIRSNGKPVYDTKFGSEHLSKPAGIAISSNDRIFVADKGENGILEFNTDGQFLRFVAKGSLRGVRAIACRDDSLYACDEDGNVWSFTFS